MASQDLELAPQAQQLTVPEPATMLDQIIRATRDNDLPLERLAFLLDIKDRIERDQQAKLDKELKAEFDAAVAECRKKIPRIVTESTNSNTNSKYTKLAALEKIIRPIYEGYKLDVSFTPEVTETKVAVLMTVRLETNGWTETRRLQTDPDTKGPKGGDVKTPVQGLGSALNYLRRYHHILFWNLTFIDKADNDGNTRGPYSDVRDGDGQDPSAVRRISGQQKEILLNLINDTGSSESKLCARVQPPCKQIEEIPANQYERVRKALLDKKAQMNA